MTRRTGKGLGEALIHWPVVEALGQMEQPRHGERGDRRQAEGIAVALLGPLEVRGTDGVLSIGGPKQRALLAILALHANQVVSTEQLAAGLWGEEPPPTAPKMLQVFVSRLRRVIDPEPGLDRTLVTQPPGYRLRLAPDQLDLTSFEALVADARSTLARDPASASKKFAQALSLWHGPPLSDLAFEPFAPAAIRRLEELRSVVLEERIDSDLVLGRHRELIGELRDLVVEHPFRERLRLQLMLALHHSGRSGEALAAYREARATFIEELGIEPGPELQRLERAILRQDASPGPDAIAATAAPGMAASPEAAPVVSGERWLSSPKADPSGDRRRIRDRRAMLAAGAVVAVVLAAGALGHGGSTAGPVAVHSNSVIAVDPKTNAAVREIRVGTGPGPIAVGDGTLWVGNRDDRTVSKVDARTGAVVNTYGLAGVPASLTVGDGVVWVGNAYTGTLSRILVAYGQVSAPFFPGPQVSGLLAVVTSPGSVWVGLGNNSLLRLDPASLRLQARASLAGHPNGLVVAGSAVWAIEFGIDAVARFDLELRSISGSVLLPSNPVAITAGAGSIWVATTPDDRLWRIDPASGAIVASVPLGLAPTAVAYGAGAMWVTGGQDGVLLRIDPANNTLVRTIRVGHPIGGVAIEGDAVWLTVD